MRLAREGMAVLFILAETRGITRLGDRIVVLRGAAQGGELPGGSDGGRVLDLIAGTP